VICEVMRPILENRGMFWETWRRKTNLDEPSKPWPFMSRPWIGITPMWGAPSTTWHLFVASRARMGRWNSSTNRH